MNRFVWLMLTMSVVGGIWHLKEGPPRPVHPGPGVHAPDVPIQQPAIELAPIRHGRFTLNPQAQFDITARLLSSRRYRFDGGAALAPIDWALGWARMSDDAILDQMKISQGGRFFSYRWQDMPPIPPDEIQRSATNAHLIPADETILKQLRRTAPGRVVRIEGLLVNAVGDDGYRWNTSLTRDDSGAGACELIYVQSVTVLR